MPVAGRTSPELVCMPLKTVTDGPLFGRPLGTLKSLTNMELRPGGYAEARGGMEELKPSGGTAADAISAGGYSAARQMSTSYGWIRSFDSTVAVNSQYSKNLQLAEGSSFAFGTGNATILVGSAMYWGADDDFNRIMVVLGTGGSWGTFTVVYEYWNGAWTALTTAETIDWTVADTPQFASWTLPTDWVAVSVGDSGTGNIYKKWMRIRVTVNTVPVSSPVLRLAQGFWAGHRELYVTTQSPRTSATSGLLRRHGQTGTTEEWFSVGSSLYSAHASVARMVEYRGRIILLNGKDTKRWDGFNFVDLGSCGTAAANTTAAVTRAAAGGGTLGAGVWRYYVAYGDGPCQNTIAYQDRQDADPLYGWGRAFQIGAELTTVAGDDVSLTLTGSAPSQCSAIAFYRTDDLTNVDAADRANAPAYMIQSFRRLSITQFESGFLNPIDFKDTQLGYVFPLQEALNFDVAPPERCKYALIYQNRLMLGNDETWYTSDPFLPDRFSKKSYTYIRLARAQGGRHMGGIEFGDQAVLWTEDQTWGLTNLDGDVPQLFPIALGVGCVAPDAACVVDGTLIWPARDGFYAWDGGRQGPRRISDEFSTAFGKMSWETHGWSKATGHNHRYDVRVASPGAVTMGTAYRFNLETGKWSTLSQAGFASTLFPLTTIHAPLGNNDAGGLHPLWGKIDYSTGAGEYGLFLGELTTQDAGTNYTCSGTMHFPLPPGAMFSASKVYAYYQASDGWQTPTLAAASSDIGSATGTLNAGTPDVGTDYSIIGGTYAQVGHGTSDLLVTFSVASQASGTVSGQRLFGAILKGTGKGIRRGAL